MTKKEPELQPTLSLNSIMVTIDSIKPNPFQPPSRLKVDDANAEKFGRSILENGLKQYPIVRAKDAALEMADGWRRLAGYKWIVEHEKLALYSNIPVFIKDLTDREMMETILETGTIRDDLTAIDLAYIYRNMQSEMKLTQEEIAKKHNCSQGEIANTIRLLELPEKIQALIISHDITETHGRYLLQLAAKPAEMLRLADECRDKKLTINQLDFEIKMVLQKETQGKKAPSAKASERASTSKPIVTTTPPITGMKPETQQAVVEIATKAAAQIQEASHVETIEPVKVTVLPRKLNLNEVEGGVFAGVMKMGATPYMRKLEGTLEDSIRWIPQFLADAEAFWSGVKK